MSDPATQAASLTGLVTPTFAIPQHTYTSAPALEVRELGGGKKIFQSEMLSELEALGPGWQLETPHEFFALRTPLTHKNAQGAHSHDESIKPGWYWTSEETPWYPGGRVVVGFALGVVGGGDGDFRAFARAVRVAGQ